MWVHYNIFVFTVFLWMTKGMKERHFFNSCFCFIAIETFLELSFEFLKVSSFNLFLISFE